MKTSIFGNLDSSKRFVLFAICILPIFAWIGPLERISYEYTNESLANAGLIYATARGINAVVSVLQSTEVSSVVLSVQIGQIADPLNDLIERFSAIMLVALGSLALQKILLEMVSDAFFNFLLTALAVATLVSLRLQNQTYYTYISRAFWVSAFLRFSLVLVVFANSWVDSAFLADREAQQHTEMEHMQGDLDTIRRSTALDEESQQEIQKLESDIPDLEQKISQHISILDSIASELTVLERALSDLRKEKGGMCRVIITQKTCPADIIELDAVVEQLKNKESDVEHEFGRISEALEQAREQLECFEKKSTGGSCGILDSISSTVSIKQNLNDLEDRMTAFSDTIISLLMSLLLKTILIPLLFLWALAKMVGVPWSQVGSYMKPPKNSTRKAENEAPPTSDQQGAATS